MRCSRLLDVLREDNRAIIRAASQASKAADYILGFLPEAPARCCRRALDRTESGMILFLDHAQRAADFLHGLPAPAPAQANAA